MSAGAVTLAEPAGAADGAVTGVAKLETQQNVLPPSYGTVAYTDVTGVANHLMAHQEPGGVLTLEDPGVVIAPVHVSSGLPNCTGGVGTATCRYARWFFIDTADGDDELRLDGTMEAFVRTGAGDDHIVVATFAMIDCGDGYDEVVATASVMTEGCEVVTQL